jgi:hypothetical protein
MASESSNSALITDDILDADLILRRKDNLTMGILSYGFALCHIYQYQIL